MNVQHGNILTVTEGIIVHQVNAQGVMGSGVARALRNIYPKIYADYITKLDEVCPSRRAGRGSEAAMKLTIWSNVQPKLWVCNLVGQQFYGDDGQRYTSYDALDVGFKNVAAFARQKELEVHYPLIGCGLGGGDWTIVSAIINAQLGTIPHTLWILPEAK